MAARRLNTDLHVHSRFAMSTSPRLDIATLSDAARREGLDLLATGDFTHPVWRGELRAGLAEIENGIFVSEAGARFILGTEISCVWKQDGRGRRVHLLMLAPGFAAAERIAREFAKTTRLESDGRPVLKMPAARAAQIAWDADERCVVIPAHIWTPWYGMLGSKSGFDSIAECFGDLAGHIRAVETGLSSDPAMNWRVADLDDRSIVSFSDAHSARSLGREFTVVESEFDYDGVTGALLSGGIAETMEFIPEQGKYHLNGHRKCGVRLEPSETPENGRCPACGRKLTLGVAQRIEDLAERPDASRAGADGLIHGPTGRPPYRRLVQLADLTAAALHIGPGTKTVRAVCDALIGAFDTEIAALLCAPINEVALVATDEVAFAIQAMRTGNVVIEPGYDGVYGKVALLE